MEKEKKEIKISLWSFYVLLASIVVLVGAVIVGGLSVVRQENNKQQGENLENQQVAENDKVQQLNVNSELVQKLYGYVSNTETINQLGFYRDDKMTVSNLEEEIKLLTVLHALIEEKNYNIVKLESLRKEKSVEFDDYEYYVLDVDESYWFDYETEQYVKQPAQTINVNGDIYEFDINIIQAKAKMIFNETINIQKHSITLLAEFFVYDDGMYKLVPVEGGGDYPYGDETRILKAETKGKELYIYDKFVRIGIYGYSEFGYTMYATSDNQFMIYDGLNYDYETGAIYALENSNITLPQYKHTFKQADNGEYYWVSTEMINKDELKIVE